MNIKEFFDYMTSKKKEKETVDYHKVENALRDLMWQEKCKKCTAIFFDSYLGDIYTIMPEFDRLFTINFNYDDNLEMVSKMLAECALIKRESSAKYRREESLLKKSANVMLYNVDTKRIIGGIEVAGTNDKHTVRVINQKERDAKKDKPINPVNAQLFNSAFTSLI